MASRLLLLLSLALVTLNQALPQAPEQGQKTESAARTFLAEIDAEGSRRANILSKFNWAYATDLSEENKQAKLTATSEYQDWYKVTWNRVQEWDGVWENFQDPQLKRQFKLMQILGTPALDKPDLDELNALQAEMSEIYSTVKICDYWDKISDFPFGKNCNLELEPEMKRILRSSNHSLEMSHVWSRFRDLSGRKIKEKYKRYVELNNKAAVKNGFSNMGDMWLEPYVDEPWTQETFRKSVVTLLQEMKPLYQQLHAYARRKLREKFGESEIGPKSPIPAHLLGNMWAQSWERSDIFTPYPAAASVDVTPEMVKQGYNASHMFELSEEFFVSLNMSKMTPEFWKNSVIEKLPDVDMICHASAWDFSDTKDFRIKQCTDITMDDFITVHHEMGHTVYQMAYSHLPIVFRTGANPGFHEAVGDVLGLSVSTPKHLHKMGLLKTLEEDKEAEINFLMEMALNSRISFLPFAYTVDRWRWDVFSGKVDQDNWNCHWWDLRYSLQGVKPPVTRSELDFDPGAKYHVPASVPYIRYFASYILQFQFHKALCLLANEYDPQDPAKPLYKCDIYQSKEAGNALRTMLEKGASRPWPETLKSLTGVDHMNAGAIREYFKPLETWLEEDNLKHGEHIGWESGGETYCERAKGRKDIDLGNMGMLNEN